MEDAIFKFLSKHIVLSKEEREMFSKLDLLKSYKKGDVLLREGEFAREYFFVVSGCIRCYHLDEGVEKTTAFFMEEEAVTPDSLVNNVPSRYAISCEQDSVLLVANPEMEKAVFEQFPKFETLCRVLSEKELAKSQATFADYINATPEERYLNLVNTKPNLFKKVPQYQIASYLGMTPESLSRIRKRQLLKQK